MHKESVITYVQYKILVISMYQIQIFITVWMGFVIILYVCVCSCVCLVSITVIIKKENLESCGLGGNDIDKILIYKIFKMNIKNNRGINLIEVKSIMFIG